MKADSRKLTADSRELIAESHAGKADLGLRNSEGFWLSTLVPSLLTLAPRRAGQESLWNRAPGVVIMGGHVGAVVFSGKGSQ